jgi:hypothetical protein
MNSENFINPLNPLSQLNIALKNPEFKKKFNEELIRKNTEANFKPLQRVAPVMAEVDEDSLKQINLPEFVVKSRRKKKNFTFIYIAIVVILIIASIKFLKK